MYGIEKKIINCKYCAEKGFAQKQCSVSTVELSNMVLDWMKYAKGPELNNANPGVIDFSISKERSDVMTYRYPLDDGLYLFSFFYDRDVRHLVATRRMN